ncbi:4'-phosphopantetheinyl transferase family protein [Pasteurella canis]|uniref:4'-phosphopantetheinyl transferase family protein n=1 Tax=Pasteurella canis TaxID=753 RepID=UPI001328A035|nr:4'-phosphopantetheinyl transferase superfamily protein [Pasteurella canis]MXN88480.1 4'-phosphopantetheinyl transferase superfamily protein [Pasteurella canis]GJJ80756.1 putative 4'-phosphopantetheinyl transferase [Pasteurella canis]
MSTFIAYANINQSYPLETIPSELLSEKLRQPLKSHNQRIKTRHRCRWVAHFLLWKLLKISQKPTALLKYIDYTESGRPQLPVDDIDFNISHSGDWVAVILQITSQGKSAVGIDIEYPNKQRDFAALLAYFSPLREQVWFQQQQDKEAAFYLSWCLREAVLKSQGVGIVKLSEVNHDPILRHISCDYCPSGQLIFSQELPFYLAFFVNHTQQTDFCYFMWDGQQLVRRLLPKTHHYWVNKSHEDEI